MEELLCRFDTELTSVGLEQARTAAKHIKKFLYPKPEVIISSPLRRALDTADIAFAGEQCPRIAHHLATECLWLSSDVGTPRLDLDPLQQIIFVSVLAFQNQLGPNMLHLQGEAAVKVPTLGF